MLRLHFLHILMALLLLPGCGETDLFEVGRRAESNVAEEWDFSVEVQSRWEGTTVPHKLKRNAESRKGPLVGQSWSATWRFRKASFSSAS